MSKIRSYLTVKPFKAETKVGQNFNGLRLSVNRLGSTTQGIGKSIESMHTLLKFQNEFLIENNTYTIETDKKRVKNKKVLKSKLKLEEKKNTQKSRRDAAAKQAVDRGKENAGKVENKKKELKPVKTFLEKIAGFFSTVISAFLVFGGLDYISKNADKIVKVAKLFFTIAKFAYKLTKIGVFAVMDGLTNMFGDYSVNGINENGIKRKFRFMFGFIQLTGGLLALRYITGPWRILTDLNFLIGAFRGVSEGNQQIALQEDRMKGGYFDAQTGKFISKDEYNVMRKAARKSGNLDAFDQRIKPNSTMGGIKNGMVRRGSSAVKGLGGRISGKLGGPGGVLSAVGSVAGGIGRIAEGDRPGEEKGTAVGAGVGKAIGGIAGAAAGTALLAPFLGPFAPMVGGFIGDFLGEFIGGQIGPLIEPIFGPLKRWFGMAMEVMKAVFEPLLKEIGPFFEAFFGVLGKLVDFIVKCISPIMKFVGMVLGGAIQIIIKTLTFTFNLIKNIIAFSLNPVGFAWNVIRGADPGKDVDLKKAAQQKEAQQKPNVQQFARGGKVTVPDLLPPKMMIGGGLQMAATMGMANPTKTFDLVGQGLIGALSAGVNMFGFVGDDVRRHISADLNRLQSEFGGQQNVGTNGAPLGTLNRVSDTGVNPSGAEKESGKKASKIAALLGPGRGLLGLLKDAIKAEKTRRGEGGASGTPSGISSSSSSGDGSDNLGGPLPSGSVVDKGAGIARKLMSSLGLNAGAAAGMPGNFVAESSLLPNVREGGGTGHSWPAGRRAVPAGYGWAQWSFSRHDTFVNKFLGGFGGPGGASTKVATDEDNYKMLMYELKKPGGGFSPAHKAREGMRQVRSLEDYKKITDPVEAARAFRTSWERANEALAHDSVRIQNAKAIYEKIKSVGGLVEFAKGGKLKDQGLAAKTKHKVRSNDGAPSENRIAFSAKDAEKMMFAAGGAVRPAGQPGNKMFIHWVASGYTYKGHGFYHSIVQGDGSVYQAHPYSQKQGVGHTHLRTSQGIGISAACLGGGSPSNFGSFPPKEQQLQGLAKEIANVAKSWGWGPSDINIKNVMTHAEAASGLDGQLPGNDNYGPFVSPQTGRKGDYAKWDWIRLRNNDEDGTGGDKLRAMARGYMGGDSTVVREASSAVANADGSVSSPGSSGAPTPPPPKPDTLENRAASLAEALKKFASAMASGKTAPAPADKDKKEKGKDDPKVSGTPAKEITTSQSSQNPSATAQTPQAITRSAQEKKDFNERAVAPTVVPVAVPINKPGKQAAGANVQQVFTPTTPGLHR